MRFLLTILFLLSRSLSFSCYNEYYALDAKGHFHQMEIGAIRFNKNFDQRQIERKLIQLQKKLRNKADFKLLSDYGLYLVKGGKVSEALIVFEALAKAHPDEYSIIANLGTTYELSGQNEKALAYIRKGLKINPNSHGGSEWIHVKVLLAKIELSKNPNYLNNQSVLNLSAKQKESEKIRNQLYTQLRERFPFCKGPDPIMADLFVDLGDCYAQSISFEHAKGLYQIAKIYYQSPKKEIDEKIEAIRKLRLKYADSVPGTSSRSDLEHGMTSKISGVPYESYLNNPNSDNYLVDWSKIELNPDKLLDYLGLKRIEEKVVATKPTEKEHTRKIRATVTDTKTDGSMLWIGLTLILLLISIIAYFKVKKKKQ